MSTSSQEPGRVVDRDNYGWYRASACKGGSAYCIDFHTRVPDYAALVRSRGPVRPVLAVDPTDAAELDHLFGLAGRKAVTSLAAAIEAVFHDLRETVGDLDDNPAYEDDCPSYEYAMRTLRAGRPGSWESSLLEGVMSFGNELNLDYAALRWKDPAAVRAAGPGRRVHRDARDQIAAIINRWVTDPSRYTEVAETLACIVSQCADRQGLNGWRLVADHSLRCPFYGGYGFSVCYPLFYSRSEHYNLAWDC